MEGAGHVLDRGQLHDRGKLEAESQDDGATAPFLTPGDLFCLSDPAATAGSPCVVVKDGFLGSVKALEAFEGAVEVERTGAMKPAGMGRGNEVWHSEHDRGDRITWITGGIRGSGELPQVLEELLQRLYALREALNEAVPGGTGDGNAAEDRLGLVDTVVSAQLARYPGDGRGYVRHRDVAHNAELSEELDRKITVLYYLNPKWEPRMGGQLRIHLDADGIGVEGSKQSTSEPANGRMWDVEPLLDRLVLFRSDIVHHEVLPALAPRLAVTLWFYGRNLGGGRACARGPARPLVPPLRAEQLPATTPATAEPCDAGGDTRSKVRSLPVPEEDGREHAMEASIFVSAVSYRDPEANPTVVDLLARASNPRRVSVGLVWQLDLAVAEDHAMYTSTPRGDDEVLRGGHLRSVLIPAADAAGPSWARRVAQSLWAGEEYFLQIDSHTRFRPGWDSYLIHTLGRCPSPKPILTTYPVGYELPHRIPAGETRPTLLVPDGFGADDGVLRQTGRLMMRKAREPLPSPLWASGFSFSSSALLLEVPYDPGLRHVFFGEEVSMAARMYTRGWDFFAPPQTVVYHLWSRAHRPSFRQVSTRETEMQEKRARGRVRRLLGLDVSRKSKKIGIPVDGNAEDRSPDFLEWYGLGDTRTLQSFENRVGVNLRSSTVLPEARNAGRPSTDFNDSLASGLKDIMGILRRAGVDSGPHGSCSDDTPQVGALEHGRT